MGKITTLVLCRQSPLNLHQFHLTRDSKYGLAGTDRNAIWRYFALLCQCQNEYSTERQKNWPFSKSTNTIANVIYRWFQSDCRCFPRPLSFGKIYIIDEFWQNSNVKTDFLKNSKTICKIQPTKHVRGTTPSLASRLAMTWGQPRPNNFGKIPVIKNYIPGCKKKFLKILNFGPVALKFRWKIIKLYDVKKIFWAFLILLLLYLVILHTWTGLLKHIIFKTQRLQSRKLDHEVQNSNKFMLSNCIHSIAVYGLIGISTLNNWAIIIYISIISRLRSFAFMKFMQFF